MKTKALALLLCACMLFSLAACAQRDPDVPEGFLLYENEDADYYFYYPEGWIKNRGDAGETSVYVSETDFSSVSVNAFTFSSEYASLTDYAERFYVPELEKHFSSVKVDYNQDGSLKTSVLKIDDCDAISFSYSATLGEEYSFRVWFISYNGYLYSVLYTAKAELYDTNFNAAEQIALNIQFK
ncbi:MAG: hypothetical protein IKC69_06615 [Clostridia bacterium]|nr:hypothetical protein [Clostridia bacterium]